MIYLLIFNGRYWQLLDDGTLVEVDPTTLDLSSEQVVVLNAQTEGTATPSGDAVTSSTSLATYFANLDRVGPEKLPTSGFQTRQLPDFMDSASRYGDGDSPIIPPLSPDAEIRVTIEDNGDGYINMFEVSVVDIFGDSLELFDNQAIEVTVTDSLGNSITYMTSIQDNQYALNGRDLSSLAQGPVTVTATATDFYGNSISAVDTSVIDTLAIINSDFVTDGDVLLNAVEIADMDVSGTTAEINPGQTITLTFTDTQGSSITESTTLAADGSYEIDDIDLSSLVDGNIQVTATSTDIPGNIANNTFTIIKDTTAAITIQFDGDPPYSAGELNGVTLSGTTADVEPGQVITVNVTDGTNSDTVTTTVQSDGSWQTAPLDLTGYNDGTLTADASVMDVAGNPATSTTDTTIDTLATIDIDTDPDGLDINALRSGQTVTVKGTTTEVEEGQVVSIRFADARNPDQLFTATVQADGSWSADVLVTGLSPIAPWTLNATVSDVAGNVATDSTPTLMIPARVILSENALVDFPAGYSATVEVRIAEYDSVIFSDQQTALETVVATGTGTNLNVVVAGDGLSLTADDGSMPVISAVLDPAAGTVTVTLHQPVEQGPLMDALRTVLAIEATQDDVDGTSETVVVDVPVSIRDSLEFAKDDFSAVVEELEVSRNVFDNDNLQEGPLRLIFIEVEGTRYEVTEAAPAVVATTRGELTVHANGDWSLVASRNNDNSDPLNPPILNFTYGALDQDGDYDSADVEIVVEDGAGGVFPSGAIEITESDYADSTSLPLDFVMTAGSDDLDPASVTFTDTQIGILDALGLTSSGTAITYTLNSPANNVLTASDGTDTVFTLTLSAASATGGDLNATVTLVQTLPLDHIAGDTLTLPLSAQASDNDGTLSYSSSSLVINDGNNPQTSASSVALDENALSPTSGNSTVDITIGSDQVADIGFTATQQPVLTSGGVALQYQVSGDGLTLTAHTGDPGDPVFTAVIDSEPNATGNSSLTSTVTLFKALDQLDSSGNSSDPLNFNLRYAVTDYDGDIVYASVPVSVSDADPATGSDIAIQLTETPKDAANLATPSSASVNFEPNASKDPIVAASFDLTDGAAVVDSSGNALTQSGVAVVWKQVSNSQWEARTTDGVKVLSLSLPDTINVDPDTDADIPLTVTVLGAIDHLDSSDNPIDNLTLPVTVNFTDSDGTSTPLQAAISIYDGRDPVALSVDTLTVDENNTLDDNTDSDTGIATASRGSDQITVIDFVLVTALTSGGNAVTLAGSPDSNSWWIASAAGNEVFRVRIGFDGTTEFQLSRPLDHDPGNGENNLPITFNASVVDADGDISNTIPLTVNVTDDIPVAEDITIVGTEGGSRTINVLDNNKGGADGATLTQLTYDDGTGAVVHLVPDGGSVSFDLVEGGQVYGTVTAYSDGRIQGDTFTTLNSSFDDSFTFQVTDADDDSVTNTINVTVRDEQATIDISPLETPEDTPLTLTLLVNPGDLDQNEVVNAITFDLAALQGGVLTLNGNPLATDSSGNPQLTGSDLILVNPVNGDLQPNGTLVFTPALNTSDPTDDVRFNVTVTVDSDSGVQTTTDSFNVSVTPVVDPPQWDGSSVFAYSMEEDGTVPDFTLQANLFDTDGSESISYRVDNIESGLVLHTSGRTLSNGSTLSASELAVLTVSTSQNYAGQLQFDLFAVSKENSTGATAEISQTVTLDVAPVADTPTLATNSIFMLEDQLVELSSFLSGSLTDNDGSETLHFQLTLPAGWMVSDASGNEVGLVSPGVYRVSDADVQAGTVYLKPLEDISSVSGTISLQVEAVAVESVADGIDPAVPEALSPARTVNVSVEGVVDNPAIGPGPDGAWSFDGTNITGTFDEDTLIPLNFDTGTEDDDGSEVFDLVIRDLPDGVQLVDGNGDLVDLKVLGEYNGKPMYSVTAAELAGLFVKPPLDYSGQILFELKQTNTEPDGDSARFDMLVDISVNPVVDTGDGIVANTSGAEDTPIPLDFGPVLADIDGSETLTNVVIQSAASGTLLLDGATALVIPVSGLDVAQLAAAQGTDFATLIASGRLQFLPPEDSDADVTLPVIFEITDTSGLGVETVQNVAGTLNVNVTAIVDDTEEDGITRIEATDNTLVSSDGSPISLTGAATFIEEDIDGSEYLDYIVISIPENNGWFVAHPNGAIHDGNGNWLIPTNGMTSDTVVDAAVELLAGATIASDHVGTYEITIGARVLDHNDDADMIFDTITVDFQVPVAGTASDMADLQLSIIDGQEDTTIDTTGHLNTSVAGDGNDVVSFRINAGEMPYGGAVTGADVITEYASDGTTVVAWVFTEASLGNLQITGVDEDFAGAMQIPVHKTATDPSGDTFTETDILDIELAPVVDQVGNLPSLQMIEDIPASLAVNMNNLLGDLDTDNARGVESLISVKFLAMSEGSLDDPMGLLVDNGDGTFTLNDISQLAQIYYVPPQHKHGSTSFDVELTVQDVTTGVSVVSDTDTQTFTQTIDVEIVADTDPSIVIAPDQTGDEDADISFSGLSVIDIDTDGSETLTVQMLGVPDGAVLFWNNGGILQQLTNDGPDGTGGFAWSFRPDQLPDLVFRPPRDFAGDIDLVLRATSMELSTQEVVVNSSNFTLEVYPVADNAEFYQDAETSYTATEGSAIELEVFGRSLEAVNPNETMAVQVVVNNSSDATALQQLSGIRTPDGKTALFTNTGSGYVATIVTSLTTLASLELFAGPNAFGSLDIDIRVGTVDTAIVGGAEVTDATVVDGPDMIVRSVTVDIEPQPDPPIINLTADNIEAAISTVPLGLSLTTVNPAPGETSDIVITGLPSGINLSAGTQSGNQWIVAEADLAGLSISNAAAGETYTLTLEPRSTLDGTTVSGGAQSLTVDMASTLSGDNTLTGEDGQSNLFIGGDGNDTMTATTGDDTFLFGSADAATTATDTITDFAVNDDRLNLSDIIAGISSGNDLAAFIDLDDGGGADTTMTIDLGGGVNQIIVLEDVTLTDLNGGVAGGTDADILQRMLDEQILISG